MRLLLLLFFLQTGLVTSLYAQSKKKSNEQLLTGLKVKTQTYDSIREVHLQLQKDMKAASVNAYNTDKSLRSTKEHLFNKLSILRKNHDLLALTGFDANTIVSDAEMKKLNSIPLDFVAELGGSKFFKTFSMSETDEIGNYTAYTIKLQNQILASQIRVYDSVNAINRNVLTDERSFIDSLVSWKVKTENEIVHYNEQILYVVRKSDELALKWRELNRQKEEREEAEYQKKLEAWQKKQKPGTLNFIPPRVFEQEGEKPVLSTDPPATEYHEMLPDNFGIDEPVPEPVQYDIVETVPEFPGGKDALIQYLKDNLVLPDAVLKDGISGKCYVRFVVSSEGKISNIKVQRSIPGCPECDAEAKRVVEKMPDWKNGTNQGKPTNMWYNLPILFKAP